MADSPLNPCGPVCRYGYRGVPQPELPREDDLRNPGHPHHISPHHPEHPDLRGTLEPGAFSADVDETRQQAHPLLPRGTHQGFAELPVVWIRHIRVYRLAVEKGRRPPLREVEELLDQP